MLMARCVRPKYIKASDEWRNVRKGHTAIVKGMKRVGQHYKIYIMDDEGEMNWYPVELFKMYDKADSEVVPYNDRALYKHYRDLDGLVNGNIYAVMGKKIIEGEEHYCVINPDGYKIWVNSDRFTIIREGKVV